MKYINEKIENKIVNEFIEKFPKMKNIGNNIKSEFKILSIFKKFEEKTIIFYNIF